jgi:hypothetical protein
MVQILSSGEGDFCATGGHPIPVPDGVRCLANRWKKQGAEIQENGRGGEIRTHDLLYPKQARYQATLRPDTGLRKVPGRGLFCKEIMPRRKFYEGECAGSTRAWPYPAPPRKRPWQYFQGRQPLRSRLRLKLRALPVWPLL